MSCCCLLFYAKIGVVLAILFAIYMKFLRRKIFAFFLSVFTRKIASILYPRKLEMFQEGFKLIEKPNKKMKILEIGVGTGANFKFYPENSEIIISDKTDAFVPYLKQTLKEINREDIKIHDFIVDNAENMISIESNSVDAVVATLTLCSIENLSAVFNELQRVLKPGGVFLFMDHSKNVNDFKMNLLQTLIAPIWKIIFDDCRFRDIKSEFQKYSKFESVKMYEFKSSMTIMNPIIYGYAQKAF